MDEAMDRDDGQKNTNSKMEQEMKKREAVNAELARVNKLPGNSGYAMHRSKVLNKVLHLMALQKRTMSQDEELELLFATLSI